MIVPEKEKLEKVLKSAKRSFWINLFLMAGNGVLYAFLQQQEIDTKLPLLVASFCGFMAWFANRVEKAVLIQLGREKEI